MRVRNLLVCIGIFILIATPAFALEETDKENIKVVVSEGRSELGEDTTPAVAKSVALNNARRNALEEAVGVTVHGSSVVYNSTLISDLVMAATKGLIVKEEILENKWDISNNRINWFIRLRAYVLPIKTEQRGSYRITKAIIQRPDKNMMMKAPVFQNGDEIQIKASASEDSYINIFGIDQNGSVSLLYPNEYVDVSVIPAGKEIVFPDEDQREMGLKLRVNTLKDLSSSVESVLIVATRKKVDFLRSCENESPMISDLMAELAAMDISTWTEKTLGYEVRK